MEVLGILAAVALAAKAVLDWPAGWPLLLVAGALCAALVLRRRYPRV